MAAFLKWKGKIFGAACSFSWFKGGFIVQRWERFQTLSISDSHHVCCCLWCSECQICRLTWKLSSAFINPRETGERAENVSTFLRFQVTEKDIYWFESAFALSRDPHFSSYLPAKETVLAGSHNGGHFYCYNMKSQLINMLDNTTGCALHPSVAPTTKVQFYPPRCASNNVQLVDLLWCCGNEIAVIIIFSWECRWAWSRCREYFKGLFVISRLYFVLKIIIQMNKWDKTCAGG